MSSLSLILMTGAVTHHYHWGQGHEYSAGWQHNFPTPFLLQTSSRYNSSLDTPVAC